MAVVTISRLLGSEGDGIASKVADRLGYDLADKSLIIEVAKRAGVSVEDAEHVDDKYESRIGKFLKSFITPRMGKILVEGEKHLAPPEFFHNCHEVIQGIAEKGNVVIVGRGGQFILKDSDNAVHVKVIADMGSRIEKVRKKYHISDHEARSMIKKSDDERKHCFEHYFHSNWNDPLAYRLIIDSSKLSSASGHWDIVKKASIYFSHTRISSSNLMSSL